MREVLQYIIDDDYLVSYSPNLGEQELLVLFIVDDFGFNNELEGWILKNAYLLVEWQRLI